MTHPAEAARGVLLPVQVYPMFETALRAAAGRDPDEHLPTHRRAVVALQRGRGVQPDHAWSRTALSPPTRSARSPPRNRVIGWPYTKEMNSNNDVDMAAAIVMCSAESGDGARRPAGPLGVPARRGDCHEHTYVSNRDTFAETPAIRVGGRRALELAGVGIDDVDIIDLYSCFPSAVQLGAAALGLDIDRQLTRTGGLAFAGGPWNNYVMHAIATVVDELRRGLGARALVWANGGFATKHAFGVYGTARPPEGGFRHDRPAGGDRRAPPPRRRRATPTGPATIEAYTVMHDRDGAPSAASPPACSPTAAGRGRRRTTPTPWRRWTQDEWVDHPVTLRSMQAVLACLSDRRSSSTAIPGHDDAMAIVVAARHAELLGITAVAGNAPLERTAYNARVMRELLGIDVPVHSGAERPLVAEASPAAAIHGVSGLDGADLPPPSRPLDSTDAVAFIIETCRAARGRVARAGRAAHQHRPGAARRARPRRGASPASR